MKYSLKVSGGIIGIPRTYEGEVSLSGQEKKKIQDFLNHAPAAINEKLRDGLYYHLQLQEKNSLYEAYFEDLNTPETIRVFIKKLMTKS